METQGQITDPNAALTFMLAGKARVTLRSLSSGNRYTYKIATAPKRKPDDRTTWFVKLLNGQDNTSDYVYIGIIRNNCGDNNVTGYEFVWTSKARMGKETPSVLGIGYVVRMLAHGSMEGFEVWHEGRCGRCGKPLTVPESIASGFGPDCIEMVGGVRPTPRSRNLKTEDGDKLLDFGFRGAAASEQPLALGGIPAYGVPATEHSFVVADDEIRRRVAEYKANSPENYYHDGELSEQEAFTVAYNKFRVEMSR